MPITTDRRSLIQMMLGVAISPPSWVKEPEKEVATFTMDCDSEQEMDILIGCLSRVLSKSIPSVKYEGALWEATNNKLNIRYSALSPITNMPESRFITEIVVRFCPK